MVDMPSGTTYGAADGVRVTGNNKVKIIDFRSDTVTQPTQEMREAMYRAVVGDDVYGEDPTVNKLEKTAAVKVGKEAALFVPSGTMGNQIAVLTHTNRGDEVIVDVDSHLAYFEVGAPSMFGGVQLQMIQGLMESNTVAKIQKAYRPSNVHYPTSSLVCLENTFNRGGGTVMPPEEMKAAYEAAKELKLKVHLDGARIFNASVAARCDVEEFTRYCDSVQFCLSKGLCAPVGSILAGEREFIDRARKYRKALGGGMRQAGILAAAGLIALNMVERLAEDHANAKLLAEGFVQIPGLSIDLERVQSNMVFVDTTGIEMDAAAFAGELQKNGVGSIAVEEQKIRFVTHRDVSRDNVFEAVKIAGQIISG